MLNVIGVMCALVYIAIDIQQKNVQKKYEAMGFEKQA